MHVDMDAFFAACEERYNPQFRGRPVVVGADPKEGRGRGVVSTANYAARKYGIKSAMPISQAWRLAEAARKSGEPETIFLRGNHQLYFEVSKRTMAILASNVDAFEEASIDEAYLELGIKNQKSGIKDDSWGEAEGFAKKIKNEIWKREGLTCSVGIGPNKLIAKIASDFNKPDGIKMVRSDEVEVFLEPLPIRVVPGVGPKTGIFLQGHGIKTVGQLRDVGSEKLVGWFGKWGRDLYQKARGLDDSPVSNEWEPKSVGEQETFEHDTLQPAFILERIGQLSKNVLSRLHKEKFSSFRSVVVTVRFSDFVTFSRSHTAPKPLATLEELNGQVLRLILPFLDRRQNPRQKKIRLIGLRVEKLGP